MTFVYVILLSIGILYLRDELRGEKVQDTRFLDGRFQSLR